MRTALITRLSITSALFLLAVATLLAGVPVAARAQNEPPPATGNAQRGKGLYTETYKCYACHGYAAETGAPTPRLAPMRRTEPQFIAYVKKPSRPAMPSYADVADADLADIYAYIRSLRVNAPPVETIPILRGLLQDINKR